MNLCLRFVLVAGIDYRKWVAKELPYLDIFQMIPAVSLARYPWSKLGSWYRAMVMEFRRAVNPIAWGEASLL
jgi:hypothetical protein